MIRRLVERVLGPKIGTGGTAVWAFWGVFLIALFVLASRGDPRLRQSVIGLAGGTAVGVGLLVVVLVVVVVSVGNDECVTESLGTGSPC